MKIGDLVRINSLSWWNRNKVKTVSPVGIGIEHRVILNGDKHFSEDMIPYCGKVAIIRSCERSCDYSSLFNDNDNEMLYFLEVDGELLRYYWTSSMFNLMRKEKLEKLKILSNEL
jgi:hypothetical protein